MEGKVLVTGSNGQLGQCLKEVVKYTLNDSNYIFTTRADFDITNIDMMREYLNNHKDISVIINCAAYTNVKKAETEEGFKQAMLINSEGAKNLAKLCNEFNIFLIHIGTEYIMELWNCKHNNCPINEDKLDTTIVTRHKDNKEILENSLIRINKYGYSKSSGIYNIINEFGNNKNYIIIITSWLYSEFGENFVKTMYNRIKNGLDTEVVYTQIGSPTYAMDLAKYIVDTIENNNCEFTNDNNNLINFANLGVASWYDIAKRVDLFICEDKITPRKEPFDDIIRPTFSVLDLEKVRSIVGNKHYLRHWTDALDECLEEIRYGEELNKK